MTRRGKAGLTCMSIILCKIVLPHACHRCTLERRGTKDSLQGPQFKVGIQLQTPTIMHTSIHATELNQCKGARGGGGMFADVVGTGAHPEFQSCLGQSSAPGLSL